MSRFRRIIDSDDDDNNDNKMSSKDSQTMVIDNIDNVDKENQWVDCRDPTTMTMQERSRNIQNAKLERNNGQPLKKQKMIKKRINSSDDDDDDIISVSEESPESKTDRRHSRLYHSFLEDTPEEKVKTNNKIFLKKLKSNDNDKTNFLDKFIYKGDNDNDLDEKVIDLVDSDNEKDSDYEEKTVKKSKTKYESEEEEEEEDDDDDDDDDDSDDDDDDINLEDDSDGYEDDRRKYQKLSDAKAILARCEEVSKKLRDSLRVWQLGTGTSQSSQESSEETKNGPEKSNSNNDCTELTKIKSSLDQDQVLQDEDIQKICPDLQLKPYQLVGVNWLKLLHQNRINGVLADDMGLGKTVQTIAFLAWLNSINMKTRRPHLIIVPASTLSNWENEIRRFYPSAVLEIYHGNQNEKINIQHSILGGVRHAELDIILTTYTMFERESGKDDRKFINKIPFSYLVLDEAHCMKNRETQRYAHLSRLRSKNRLLLSGTPVQNDLGELLALLSFLMPEVFGHENCDLLLEAFGLQKGVVFDKKTTGGLSLKQIKSMLAPFILRRRKSLVLDQLVAKETYVRKIPLTVTQRLIYERILIGYSKRKQLQIEAAKLEEEESRRLNCKIKGTNKKKKDEFTEEQAMKVDLTEDLSIVNSASIPDTFKGLTQSEAKHLFTALRKAAYHPLLLRVKYRDDDVLNKIANVSHIYQHFGNQCDLQRVRAELDKLSDFDLHQICMEYRDSLGQYELSHDSLYESAKFVEMKLLLPKLIAEDHRILIFSQWTRLLDLLEVLMYDLEITFLRLDGSTPIAIRQELIDKFNRDNKIPVFILSTKAGGLGINLTSADTVIMHDLDFNPENDRQAEDRCHRIGQTKAVKVYKLVCDDSVDEDIYDMTERKTALSTSIFENENSKENNGKADDNIDVGSIQNILMKTVQKFANNAVMI